MKNSCFSFKVVGIFFLTLLATYVSLNSTKVDAAETAPKTVTFVLHNLLFNSEDVLEEANDGTADPFENSLENYTGLNGATFTVYDVTTRFYQLRLAGKTVEEAQSALAELDYTQLTAAASEMTATNDDAEGIAKFTLPVKVGEHEAVYLFAETGQPKNVKQAADPLVVVLPVQNAQKENLTQIQLYPKNEAVPHENPPLKKIVDTTHVDFAYGAAVPYKITSVIPDDVWSYTTYQLSDEADQALVMRSASLKIRLDGKLLKSGYQEKTTAHGFTVDFDCQMLKRFVGKKVTVTYEMTLTAASAEQTSFENRAVLTPGDNPKVETDTSVVTGGKDFVKVDMIKNEQQLKGAEFVVRNKDGDYLQQGTAKTTWVAAENLSEQQIKKHQLLRLISGEDGSFFVNGLSYGTYQIIEVKAPDGYVLTNEPISFTVDKNSLRFGKEAALAVVNRRAAPPSKEEPETPLERLKVPLTKLGIYPKTGEQVRKSLVYIGIIIIVIVLMIIGIKRRKNEEEGQ